MTRLSQHSAPVTSTVMQQSSLGQRLARCHGQLFRQFRVFARFAAGRRNTLHSWTGQLRRHAAAIILSRPSRRPILVEEMPLLFRSSRRSWSGQRTLLRSDIKKNRDFRRSICIEFLLHHCLWVFHICAESLAGNTDRLTTSNPSWPTVAFALYCRRKNGSEQVGADNFTVVRVTQWRTGTPRECKQQLLTVKGHTVKDCARLRSDFLEFARAILMPR